MILITGGTGFVGQALVKNILESGHKVRLLIRPQKYPLKLPTEKSIEIIIGDLNDEQILSSAMKDTQVVYHLATGGRTGKDADLIRTDVHGTQMLSKLVQGFNIKRLIFVSHLGADRSSAYPVLKAKAIAEQYIQTSGTPYTIIRSAVVYGQNDYFTTGLAKIISALPLFFFMPGNGEGKMQPIWIEDLCFCLRDAMENEAIVNSTVAIGGPEYLSLNDIVSRISDEICVNKRNINIKTIYLRWISVTMEYFFRRFPLSSYWLDYFSADRTCTLETTTRTFQLLPSQFSQRIAYLGGINWRNEFFKSIFVRGPR